MRLSRSVVVVPKRIVCLFATGVWEPAPQDIKELYEKLAAGEELTLTWSWPRGRRSPSPEPAEESMEQDTAPKEVQKEEKYVQCNLFQGNVSRVSEQKTLFEVIYH